MIKLPLTHGCMVYKYRFYIHIYYITLTSCCVENHYTYFWASEEDCEKRDSRYFLRYRIFHRMEYFVLFYNQLRDPFSYLHHIQKALDMISGLKCQKQFGFC